MPGSGRDNLIYADSAPRGTPNQLSSSLITTSMADLNQRKRAHSTTHGLRRNIKDLFRSPSPQPAEASAGTGQPSSPTTSQPTIPAISTTGTAYQGSPATHRGLRERARATMTELETALKGLQVGAKLCSPVALAAEGLLGCMDIARGAAQASDELEQLALSLAKVVVDVEKHMTQAAAVPQASEFIGDVALELQNEVSYLRDKTNRPGRNRLAEATKDIDDLVACYRRIGLVMLRLQNSTALSVWWIAHRNLMNTLLEGMKPAKTAWFNSAMAAVVGRRACTPDTRIAILKGLREWAGDPNSAKVYWINGMAGTGKTTISYTFCEELESKHELGASFFCSHRLPDCRDASRIIPTIAYQLARFSNPFQAALCRALEGNPDLMTRHVGEQFEMLLRKPLQEVKDTMKEGRMVVVVEALDECDVPVHVRQFIDALFHHVSSLPIRFFVTSRPTPMLYEKLQSQYASSRAVLRLHDIQEEVVQRDIEEYLTAELASVPSGTIKRLAELSGKLFIFAATVVGYVRPRGGSVRQKRLDAIVGATWSQSDGVYRSIDTLYTAILSAMSCDEESNETEKAMTMQVLGTVICAREPLTTDGLAGLLDTSVDEVELALEPLLPVLHVNEDNNLVSTLHASFSDYMLDKERSEQYFCDHNTQNAYLTRRCLETMRALLHFNMCDLETSYVLDEEVLNLNRRVRRSIPSHLAYACRYIGEHIHRAGVEQELVSRCLEFVKTQMLYWIEVLNLLKSVSVGITALMKVQKWLQLNAKDGIEGLLLDAQKFLKSISRYDVSRSTPHIYVSVLALWRREAPMWRYYGTLSQGLPWSQDVVIGVKRSTDLAAWSIGSVSEVSPSGDHQQMIDDLTIPVSDSLRCPVFAADGSRYAIEDCSGIYICDPQTNSIVSGPYTNGYDRHRRPDSFSYNGKWIAKVSDECDVMLWNTSTESCLSYLPKWDTSTIEWVMLSPGDLLLASQNDGYSSVWNLCTLTRQTLIESDDRFFFSSAWSPDGSQLAAVDSSGVLCLWATCDGQQLFRIGGDISSNPFDAARYSHSGTRIALMSESELFIWDTQSDSRFIGPLQTHHSFNSPIFTPDDRYVVLCGGEIGVWDTHTGDKIAGYYTLPWDADFLPWEFQTTAFTPDGYLTCLTSDARQFKWRLDMESILATSSIVSTWTIDKDGWVTGPNSERLLWIVPDVVECLGKKLTVMHEQGPFGIAWDRCMVGELWRECWMG